MKFNKTKLQEEEDKKNLIFGKYKLKKVIGSGSFGYVYQGINVIDNKGVAIKVEKKELKLNLLEKESFYLYNLKGIGVPEVISYGYSGKYNILVQTLLGESLGRIFFNNKNHFSIKDICMFSIQILHRIEYVHSKFIIHRDIKPENFLIGNPDEYMIYIIDFGLSKKYKSSRTNKHVQFRLTKKFTGTARYASINAVRGAEQSRRDDLEAIGYMLLFFLNGGKLPWQGISCKAVAEKYIKIYNMKKNLNLEEFCKDMPKEIIQYINYCRQLEFEQKPNYNYLRELFENILKKKDLKNDLQFSWIKDLSILKNCTNIKNKITPTNMGRKVSPRSRIIKKLESSRKSHKTKEIDKTLKPNSSIKHIENEIIYKNPTYNQFIFHRKLNSTGDSAMRKNNNRGSENMKSGIAQYNMSLDDEQMIDTTSTNKKMDINMIKEALLKNKDILSFNQNTNKNNLYYFSNINIQDYNRSLKLNKNRDNLSNAFNKNSNSYFIKKQNTNSFLNHNRIFSSNSINNNSNINNSLNNLKNNISEHNIVKSLSYIKKDNPNIIVDTEINLLNTKKINDNNIIIQNRQNYTFNKNIDDNLNNNLSYIKGSYTVFKTNNNIKKPNNNINIYRNRSENFFNVKLSDDKINNNNYINDINSINKKNIIKSNSQIKNKKIINNMLKKDKKRKIVKMKLKNVPNKINIQNKRNIINCKSASNILKKDINPNNKQINLKYAFIQKKNNNLKRENILDTQNLSNNLSNNNEGKINKIKNMDIHINIKKDNQNNFKKIPTKQLIKEHFAINNNINILSQNNNNQKRIVKYKNLRHKTNYPIQKSKTKVNNDSSIQKSPMINGTVNTSINNSNTINNTINSNNNNNTIISIYNNYNINKNANNKHGFIHKRIENNNFDLNIFKDINKGKKYFYSYNGYNLKYNKYNNYIQLNPRKNSTITNMPTLNKVLNTKYHTLNSRINSDINNNNYISQISSNKDFSFQDKYSNKIIDEYFSFKKNQKEIKEYKKNQLINFSSSRPNINSFKIKNMINEINENVPNNNNKVRNIVQNFIDLNPNVFTKKNIIDKVKSFDFSNHFNRNNSFFYKNLLMSKNINTQIPISNLKNNDYNHSFINRKKTDIFYQRLPNLKMDYNNLNENLINGNNDNIFKSRRAKSKEFYRFNRGKEYDFFL